MLFGNHLLLFSAFWTVLPFASSFAPLARTIGFKRSSRRNSGQGLWGQPVPPDTSASTTDVTKEEDKFVSKYPEEEAKYNSVLDAESKVPFSVETGKGPVWYYLSAQYDRKRVAQIAGEMHNCKHCKSRMSRCAGYFGPDGYAVDFGGVENGGPLYSQIERERPRTPQSALNNQGTFIISQDKLDLYPRVLGTNPESGSPFYHLGLNIPPNYITNPELASKITSALLSKLWSRSMDGLLYEIITVLQRRDTVTGKTDLEIIKSAIERDEVLRKDFWRFRLRTIEDIQQFARKFQNGGKDWELMSDIDKMHVRMFALLYGGNVSANDNPHFTATRQVVDMSKDGIDIDSLPNFMNDRTNPNTYMVQQVARANMKRSVNAPFIVSLSWNNPSDLDGHILTGSEHIFYGNKDSRDGETYLNFDANAGSPTKEPVETFTLSSKYPGRYKFLVNNYNTRGNSDAIPFTVVVKLAGETQTFQDGWDCRTRGGANPKNYLSRMIDVCTVEITQEMIDELKVETELSQKQANRLKEFLPEFQSKFGSVTTEIADMSALDGHVLITNGHCDETPEEGDGATAKLRELESLVASKQSQDQASKNPQRLRQTLGSRSSSGLNAFDDILRSLQADPGSVSVAIRGRNYYPSTLTSHSCGEQLARNAIVNSYIEEGKPPVQPDASVKETCRFEIEWSSSFSGLLFGTAAVPVKTRFYDGYFLSLGNTHLPTASDVKWCLGAGMYPTDLTVDNHKFREIWASLHSAVRPTVALTNDYPAIGVFLHRGKSYEIIVNGKEKMVSV